MKSHIYIPESKRDAGANLRLALAHPLPQLSKVDFVRAWSSIAYLFPGLHPDGYEEADSGWSRSLLPFAAEAWRRAAADDLNDDELYPSDAQWSGLYDQLLSPTPDETARRRELAAVSLECSHA